MKRDNEPKKYTAGDQFHSILSTARPRAVPNSARKEIIFGELRNDWLTRQHAVQTKRRYFFSGIAASIVVAGVFALQINFDTDSPLLPPNATVVRSAGNGTLINNRAIESFLPIDAKLRFATGDTIETGDDAALAIAWNTTGSLRVNSSSTVTLISHDHIELINGEIYYDSRSIDALETSVISVETPLGTIRHIGTQFLAKVDSGGIEISVREGQVEFGSHTSSILYINGGESVRVNGSLTPVFSTVGPTDESWNWTSAIAPYLDAKGRSTHDIIRWLSRETGRTVEYADESAEDYALADQVRGIGKVEPLTAIAIIPIATALQFDIDNHTIRVWLTD